MDQIKSGEILGLFVVLALLIICLAPVLWHRWRSKREERPRLLSQKAALVHTKDWRYLIPQDYQTEETSRLFNRLTHW